MVSNKRLLVKCTKVRVQQLLLFHVYTGSYDGLSMGLFDQNYGKMLGLVWQSYLSTNSLVNKDSNTNPLCSLYLKKHLIYSIYLKILLNYNWQCELNRTIDTIIYNSMNEIWHITLLFFTYKNVHNLDLLCALPCAMVWEGNLFQYPSPPNI